VSIPPAAVASHIFVSAETNWLKTITWCPDEHARHDLQTVNSGEVRPADSDILDPESHFLEQIGVPTGGVEVILKMLRDAYHDRFQAGVVVLEQACGHVRRSSGPSEHDNLVTERRLQVRVDAPQDRPVFAYARLLELARASGVPATTLLSEE
jgi:hypothetical protein